MSQSLNRMDAPLLNPDHQAKESLIGRTGSLHRRDFLAGAIAGLGVIATNAVQAQSSSGQSLAQAVTKLQVGISTMGFPDLTNEKMAQEAAGAGLKVVQLFLSQSDSRYWNYNGRSDVSSMTADRSKAIAEAYRAAGVSIHSIGVYTNLIHPDKSEVEANLAYFDAMMKIGSDMGVHTFITEAGHYHDKTTCPDVPLHFLDEVWVRMVMTFKRLADMAANHNAKILVEPYFQSFFSSAKRTRVFLEEVGSDSIRALLDPANILELNDLEEMFSQLGPWIDCIHAKDRKLHTQMGVPAGQGDVDYVKMVSLAARLTPHAPLILEYVGPHDYHQALEKVQTAIKEVHGGEP